MAARKPKEPCSDCGVRHPKRTARQERFCHQYIVDLNGARAARDAGFAKKHADRQACELLGKPQVQCLVQKLKREQARRFAVDADTVLQGLLKIATLDFAECYDDDGKLLPYPEWPDDIRRAMSSVKTSRNGEVVELRAPNKVHALEILGKHLKLFSDSMDINLSMTFRDRLRRARARARIERGG